MADNEIKLTRKELRDAMIPQMKRAWLEMKEFLADQRKKYGATYNWRNNYELIGEKFGNAEQEPEKFANEYFLIEDKVSRLPAGLRNVVRHIGGRAITLAVMEMRERERER